MAINIKQLLGTSREDKAVARARAVELNAKRQAAADAANAGKQPGDPGYVTPQLMPLADNAQVWDAYEQYWAETIVGAHASWIPSVIEADNVVQQIRERVRTATDQQRAAALAALGG